MMLQVQNLVKSFKSKLAVNDISFQVNEGEIYGLLGSNGAGKTTTIKIIMTLLRPDSGQVLIRSQDVFTNPVETKKLIGYSPETPLFYEKLTGEEFLHFIGKIRGVKGSLDKISNYADMFEMSDSIRNEIGSYSRGMRQKLALMGALIDDPEYLILDEPTAGLDPRFNNLIKRLILEEKKRGRSILLSTHLTVNAEEICDRIGVIHNGILLAEGTVEELMSSTGSSTLEEVFIKLVGGGKLEQNGTLSVKEPKTRYGAVKDDKDGNDEKDDNADKKGKNKN